jgi:outer membrane protein OmpA-like peptidoglycan-associated protein
MRPWPDGAEWIALVLEAAGVLLLFVEVLRGHAAERHDHDFRQLDRIESLMQRGQWLDAWAEFRFYEDPAPGRLAQARQMAAAIGPAQAQQTLQAAWQGGLAQRLDASRLAWIYWTAPRNLRDRRRLLWLGSGLIVAALLLQGALFAMRERADPQDDVEIVDDDTAHDAPATWRAGLVHAESAIRFDVAEASLRYRAGEREVDLTPAVCEAKRALAAADARGVLVVGHADRRELRRDARVRWASNTALAQARADAVAEHLSQSNECGPALTPVVRVVGGPRFPGRAVTEAQLAADRSVVVYGLVTREESRTDRAP